MVDKKIEHSCCFTGHRPERLDMPQEKVIQWLNDQVDKAIADGYTTFISGMQRGVDIWAAEAVVKRKNEGADIRLIAACAFKGMEERWEQEWKECYKRLLNESSEIYYIGKKPGRAAFFERDEWMVDQAGRLIGVYTGAPGGTFKTISYGKEQDLEVILIDEKLFSREFGRKAAEVFKKKYPRAYEELGK